MLYVKNTHKEQKETPISSRYEVEAEDISNLRSAKCQLDFEQKSNFDGKRNTCDSSGFQRILYLSSTSCSELQSSETWLKSLFVSSLSELCTSSWHSFSHQSTTNLTCEIFYWPQNSSQLWGLGGRLRPLGYLSLPKEVFIWSFHCSRYERLQAHKQFATFSCRCMKCQSLQKVGKRDCRGDKACLRPSP